MDNGTNRPPKWIEPLLFLAAFVLLGATAFVLIKGGSEIDHKGGPIADITFNLNGEPVREHCVTCHTEGGRPLQETWARASAPHPDIAPHRIDLLGCTSCHLGEGMALDERISHGLPGFGARKILSGQQLQARCFACHPLKPLPGADEAWSGYVLFQEKGCGLCHRIAAAQSGGRFGPDLSDIGSRFGLEKLAQSIKDPDLSPTNSIMPRFPFSSSQVRSLSYFLKSRIADPYFATPMQARAGRIELPEITQVPQEEDLKAGEELLYLGRCLACHKYGAQDGRIAPDLTWIGQMRAKDFLGDFIASPARMIPGAIMPDSSLSPEEEKALVDFLQREARGQPAHATPKHLYMQLCQRCHAANGDGKGLIQPNLATFPRAFTGNAQFFKHVTRKRLICSIDQGIAGTSMPPYGELLSPEERQSLLDLIFKTFVGIEPPVEVRRPPVPPAPDQPLARRRIEQAYQDHCRRCHGLAGTGRGPEALEYLPRPRNLTNTPYFNSLDNERIARTIAYGLAGTAMPALGQSLSAGEIWGLVDKIRDLSQTGTEGQVRP